MIKYDIITLTLSSSLIGGVVVAIFNYFFSKRLKIREAKLKQLDKILNKQFDSYENILSYFELFKTMVEVPQSEVLNFEEFWDGKVLAYPYCFINKDKYLKVTLEYRRLRDENEKWVDSKLKLKLFEFETYIFNLGKIIENINDENYWKAGVIVRNDIVYYTDEIIELCYKFYNQDIFSNKINFKNKQIHYDYSEMNKILKNMNFYKYQDKIRKL